MYRLSFVVVFNPYQQHSLSPYGTLPCELNIRSWEIPCQPETKLHTHKHKLECFNLVKSHSLLSMIKHYDTFAEQLYQLSTMCMMVSWLNCSPCWGWMWYIIIMAQCYHYQILGMDIGRFREHSHSISMPTMSTLKLCWLSFFSVKGGMLSVKEDQLLRYRAARDLIGVNQSCDNTQAVSPHPLCLSAAVKEKCQSLVKQIWHKVVVNPSRCHSLIRRLVFLPQ